MEVNDFEILPIYTTKFVSSIERQNTKQIVNFSGHLK